MVMYTRDVDAILQEEADAGATFDEAAIRKLGAEVSPSQPQNQV